MKAPRLGVSVLQVRSNPILLRLVAITGLLLLAWLLRLFQIETQSIWWDEGISLHLATSGLGDLIADRLNNVHPPLYFILLKGWVGFAGDSAFSGRYFSALASLLQVALVFALLGGGRLKQAAWVAAILVALSPLSVIYGQEIRVYALLPVVYLGMLLKAERYWQTRSKTALVALALLEWIALHLHYISVFALAYVVLAGLWKRREEVESDEWRVVSDERESQSSALPISHWLVAHALVALASLPWFAAVFFNRAAVQSEANAGTFATEPVPLDYLFPQVWAFHLTGLANALARPAIVWITGIAAVALVIALLVARVANPQLRFKVNHPKPGYRGVLLLQWLLPLGSALVVWSVRSFSHPRYVIIFAIALFPLLAVLIAPAWERPRNWMGWLRRGSAVVLGITVLYLSLWGLGQYFFNPNVAKPDMRGVARFLETAAQPDDLIIIPNTDWSLPFEYQGSTPVLMAPSSTCHLSPATCNRWLFATNQPRRAFAVDYPQPQGTRDWQGRTLFELERQGTLLATYPFDDLLLREYQLGIDSTAVPDCQDTTNPATVPVSKRFGPLLLRSAWVEQGAAADTAVTLMLCWEVQQPVAERYSVAMRLLDDEGWLVSQADTLLVDSNGRPTEQWPQGAAVTTYHILPLAIGTPPLAYPLAVSVYSGSGEALRTIEMTDEQGRPQGQQARLGDTVLSSPQFNEAGRSVHNPYSLPEPPWLATPVQMAEGLQLVAAEFGRGPYLPGQSVPVYLTWKATQVGLPPLVPEVLVGQDGETLVAASGRLLAEQYPTPGWLAGEIVRERRIVEIPVSATSGEATLTVRLADREELLGMIEIAAAESLESLPADVHAVEATFGNLALLLGYHLMQTTVNANEGIAVTLYWQALQTGGEDYTVFIHLVDEDGRLIGQHDGEPAEGRRPISTWITGELLADLHLVTLQSPSYRGPARINVGLYDPQTGQRLLLPDGRDFFQLPAKLTIED